MTPCCHNVIPSAREKRAWREGLTGAVAIVARCDTRRRSAGTTRCNCSFCTKTRYWGGQVQPEDFRLLSPEDAVGLYQFGSKVGSHHFCPACGVASYSHGYVEELGGAYCSINVATLDDVEPSVLAEVSVQYLDGRNDRWDETPAEVRHL